MMFECLLSLLVLSLVFSSQHHSHIQDYRLKVFTMISRRSTLLTVLLSILYRRMSAFPLLFIRRNIVRTVHYSTQDDKASSTPFSIQESTEMQQLILSLSLESSDQSRRDRLAMIYDNEFSKRFAILFDKTLMEMGTVIQESAKAQAMSKQKKEQEDGVTPSSSSVVNNPNSSEDYMSLNRSIEERQLWAMVDMMVQSKILTKRKLEQLQRLDDFQ